MTQRVFLAGVVVLLAGIGLLPVLSMLARSVTNSGHLGLEAYRHVLASRHQWVLMEHSLLLSLLVTALTVAVGAPLGVLLGKTDLALRRALAVLFVVPLLNPPYITAISWVDLLARDGLAARFLGAHVAASAEGALFGLAGCVWTLFCTFLPIPLLLTMIFLRAIPVRLEEAGRLVSGWRGVLRGITLPLLAPGLLLAAVLVFLLSFGEFGVPSFLRYDVFPVESFTQFSAFYDFRAATASAVPLAGVTLFVLLAEARFLRARTYQVTLSTGSARLPPIPLGPHRGWLFAATAALAGGVVVVPVLVLVIGSAGPRAYVQALQGAGASLLRSVAYAAAGASLLAVLGFFSGYLIQTRALACWRALDSMTLFLFALPSTVIGIGLVSLWNTPWTNFVYATPGIILLGYVAKYTVLSSRICVAQLAGIPRSMEEAAQAAGAGWFRRLALILAPLARRGLLGSWLVGYIFCLRDTGITMLVYPPGHETLPVHILTSMANGSGQRIAALCLIMIAATLIPPAVLWRVLRLRLSPGVGR